MSKAKVLIVDDNVQMIRQLDAIMREDPGVIVVGKCQDGMEALRLIEERDPDIVLLDLIMPKLDGMEVLAQVMHREKIGPMPAFIVISAIGQESIIEQVFSLGALYYLMKPFDAETVIKRVHEAALKRNLMLGTRENPVSPEPRQERHKTLERMVNIMLSDIGVPANVKGYQYIRDALMLCSENKNLINMVTKSLYPAIAMMNNTTPSRVERAIRHAIEISWSRGNKETLDMLFGYTLSSDSGRPTNSEFIALLSDKIRMEYKNQL